MNVSADFTWKSRLVKPNNSPLLPSNLRALCIGKSNSGKSVLIFNLLLQPGWVDYNHLFVFAKTLHQTECLTTPISISMKNVQKCHPVIIRPLAILN